MPEPTPAPASPRRGRRLRPRTLLTVLDAHGPTDWRAWDTLAMESRVQDSDAVLLSLGSKAPCRAGGERRPGRRR
ncbi:hypothetical protein O1L60_42235 [Streptomyces diastatochromogenes]|nr:hypothetical protein [Streptomyces diastatochromogenes]